MTEPTPRGVTLRALVALIGGEIRGEADTQITHIASANAAQPGALTFAVDARRTADAAASAAAAVIVRERDVLASGSRTVWVHPDPYYAYAKAAQHLFPRTRAKAGVHPTAFIEPSARVDASAEIGPFVYIAPHAQIGAHARIHAGVRIGTASVVGEDSELFPNVVMYAQCALGKRAIVHAGAVIGADGFGFAPHAGAWEKIPQTGRVVIGDDVEIGANTTIDRGALDDTVIGNGVKLDNQIQVGHNCTIGDHAAIAGCAGLAGSTHIGKHCMIGGAAMIIGHTSVADGTVVSAGTLISDNITTPGRYTGVFPAVEHRAWQKMAVRVRKLSRD